MQRLQRAKFSPERKGLLLPQGFEAFDVEEKGAWEKLPGGGAALRLSIRSQDAGSHIVVFRCARAVLVLEGHM